ncbi:sarcosine oxidase subunit gamma [Labrys portucalensis]|uniref:Sarcosine oxidase subunit gamma n=1 Tax=Labrys neptuniae TaxID=376174 RepID=A0ABV6Z7L7_9HYPH
MFDAMSAGRLESRSAFAGLLKPVGTGAGVTVQDRSGLEIVTLAARKGQEGALAARMQAAYGLRLPNGPKRVVAGSLAALGTGPSAWLVTREAGGPNLLVSDLIEAVGTLASVTDQTSGYAVLRVSGPHVRDMFAKGLDIDLHPRAFAPGDTAVTACSHIGVTLWQLDETPTYEIALFRSMAGSFWHWLSDSAAEFGLAA